jgi:Uma2 family endonuclease
MTPQEYLARERAASFKSEFYRGQVFAMAGATRRHNLIVSNTIRTLGNLLEHRPCEVYPSDMRVLVPATGLYTYPDVSIVCGEPQFEDALLNPLMLVEVLSKSTEARDRGKKFAQYRTLDSLRDYLLIAQDEHRIDRFSRQSDGLWSLGDARGLESTLQLPSLGIVMPLAGIYAKVNIEAPEEDAEAEEQRT